MDIIMYVLVGFIVIFAMLLLFQLPRRLFLLSKKTNIGRIPYSEIHEEVLTLWFLLMATMFGIYVAFYYIIYGAGLYIVGNLLQHVWELLRFNKTKDEQSLVYYYSKTHVKKYIEQSPYNKEHVRFKYNHSGKLKEIQLLHCENDDVEDLISRLRSDPKISKLSTLHIKREKIILSISIVSLVIINLLITWYLYLQL